MTSCVDRQLERPQTLLEAPSHMPPAWVGRDFSLQPLVPLLPLTHLIFRMGRMGSRLQAAHPTARGPLAPSVPGPIVLSLPDRVPRFRVPSNWGCHQSHLLLTCGRSSQGPGGPLEAPCAQLPALTSTWPYLLCARRPALGLANLFSPAL